MKSTAPFTTTPLFIRTASGSSQCPFFLEKKEQAEVGQSPTLCPYATAMGFESILRECFTNQNVQLIGKIEFPKKFQLQIISDNQYGKGKR